MKSIVLLILINLVIFNIHSQSDFLNEQKKYERVRTAIRDKQAIIYKSLTDNGLSTDDLDILIVAYKATDELELYAKKKSQESYKLIISYEICSRSGKLGPKRKQGDRQVPEGFYYIDRFNPSSKFYLSLGINYPN